jgi:hypothetical protein
MTIRNGRIPSKGVDMITNRRILAATVVPGIAALLLLTAFGCGGSKNDVSHTVTTPPVSPAVSVQSGTASSQSDCEGLDRAVNDLEMLDAIGSGFDYPSDTSFIDGYADRAPEAIADSVKRLRDVMDKFASVAQKVGLAPGDEPLPDQADEIVRAFHFSSDDQAANVRALQTIDAWVGNECI